MSFKEFYLFKNIAKFFFEFTIGKNNVIVSCNSERLEELKHILTLKLLHLKTLKNGKSIIRK